MKIDVIIDFSDDVKSIFKEFFDAVKKPTDFQVSGVSASAPDAIAKADAQMESPAPVTAAKKAPAKKATAKVVDLPKNEPADDDLASIMGTEDEDPLDALEKEMAASAGKPADNDPPLYTLDRVKEKVKTEIQNGKSKLVQELIMKYGAHGVSSLKDIHYNAFMADLNKI